MKRFETFLNENYRAVKNVTKRPDMQDHAKTFRVMVKGIKANPGQEILFTKKIEDPEYTKRTGLGDSTGIEVQSISGKPLGKPWTEKRGNREYTYEVIAISESTQSRIHAAHQKAALNAIKPKMFYALAGEVIYGPYKSKADAHKGEGGAYEEILSSTELTKRIKKGTLYTYEIDEAVSLNEEKSLKVKKDYIFNKLMGKKGEYVKTPDANTKKVAQMLGLKVTNNSTSHQLSGRIDKRLDTADEKTINQIYSYLNEETSVNEELIKTVSIEPQDADELMKTYTPAVTAVLRKYGLTPGSGANETVRIYSVEHKFPDYTISWNKFVVKNKVTLQLTLKVHKREKKGLGGRYFGSLKDIVKEIDRVGKQLS